MTTEYEDVYVPNKPYHYTTNKKRKQFKIKIELYFDTYDNFKGIEKRLENCINKNLNKKGGSLVEDTEYFKIKSIEEF